jgi:phi13 family phage major tail protein
MQTAEFRGCDNLVVARVTKDDATGYTTGAVTPLAEVAQIAKTTEQSSETHYYDNVGKITIKAIGSDTVTLTVPAMALEKLALVTGGRIDPATGAYSSTEQDTNYEYALGYRLKLTDGTYRYVWRLKGTFSSVPDETSETESNSINTNNQQVVYTGTLTSHAFSNGGRARDFVTDERDGKANVDIFFTNVKTPDNSANMAIGNVTALSISPATKTLEEGDTFRYTLNITPAGIVPIWRSSNPAIAVIDERGDITALSAGVTTITATAGTLSASSTLTVTAAGD